VEPGRAMQVDPIKPTVKVPGTKRLKLICDILLSTSAFKFNLRRYNLEDTEELVTGVEKHGAGKWTKIKHEAGAALEHRMAGRCRLTLSNPR